jgi:monoamine oxidase
VLEARDRVGGRLESIDGLDLGASWFWPNEPRIARLVDELGVSTHPQYLDGNAKYQDHDGAHEMQGNPLDVPSYRFSRGADSITDTIARELPPGTVRLHTAVRSIALVDDSERVRVATGSGTVVARHAVIALPPALAVATIEFDPPLPDRLAGLARSTPVWMGAITKVVIRFADAFWRDRGWSGSAISHIGPMREIHDMSGPDGAPAALFGFVPSQQVGSPTVTEAAVAEQLVTLFGNGAASPTAIVIRDWRHQPFTSPPGVERLSAYQTFGHDLFQTPAMNGRLHWSSTETSRSFPGHIEGALEAAERTAHAITSTNPEPA